ncbi:hypothetical protein V6N11_055201 [Hibiscus sabdariffa]|uniref:N-acetyltransferase domain-containing protein n=1 Tax=Hibiscus sabdariffa TaxID=183260 RepID=A0ABR2PFC8_9ROSI
MSSAAIGNNPPNVLSYGIRNPAYRASGLGISLVLDFIRLSCRNDYRVVCRSVPIDFVIQRETVIGTVLESHVCIYCRTRLTHHLNLVFLKCLAL